jgi:transposase
LAQYLWRHLHQPRFREHAWPSRTAPAAHQLASARRSTSTSPGSIAAWLNSTANSNHIRSSPLRRERDDPIALDARRWPSIECHAPGDLPELGTVSHKEIAALVGVAPFNQDSGKKRGERVAWGSRAAVRAALYMATLVATRRNPIIGAFYQRQLAAHKLKKLAITARMHKLFTILNGMVRHNVPWSTPGRLSVPSCAFQLATP